jgi:phosphoadenosine phosphosulfate reductase
MAFVGVRGDESLKRSGYEYISVGTKHKGQYSCNPILSWSSAEVYLYIFDNDLWLNKTYTKGNGRAGCLICPMSGERQDFMRRESYPEEVRKYIDVIHEMSAKDYPTEAELIHFIDNGGWKARNNGRDIRISVQRYREVAPNSLEITSPLQDWTEWMKTVGNFDYDGVTCTLVRGKDIYKFAIEKTNDGYKVSFDEDLSKRDPAILKAVKNVFRKAANCIGCQECQADCPYGCLTFEEGKILISPSCRKCLNCHKPDDGCLVYKSIQQPKGNGKMNNLSIDSYADHAPKMEWIQSYFELKNDFMENHALGSMMFSMFRRFLRDAELLENNQFSKTAQILDKIGLSSPTFWGILLVNLSYAPEVGWFIRNVEVDSDVSRSDLIAMLKDAGCSDRGTKSVTGAYKRILTLPFGDLVGLGSVLMDGKTYQGIHRGHWFDPVPEVILYSLYKFAEACGGYFQFSLETLLDDSIERDGISPTRIFGLNRETMVRILNGLSINYPEFISASFTLDLDNITLRDDKTAEDVLQLL